MRLSNSIFGSDTVKLSPISQSVLTGTCSGGAINLESNLISWLSPRFDSDFAAFHYKLTFQRAQNSHVAETIITKENIGRLVLSAPNELQDGAYQVDLKIKNLFLDQKPLVQSCTVVVDNTPPQQSMKPIEGGDYYGYKVLNPGSTLEILGQDNTKRQVMACVEAIPESSLEEREEASCEKGKS